jgi:hypothetical protein
VSIDTKTLLPQGEGERHDEEGTKAFRYILAWVLPKEDLDNLMAAGAELAPAIIYARGVPADPPRKSTHSTARTVPSSYLRSAFAGTSADTRSAKKKPINTTPY